MTTLPQRLRAMADHTGLDAVAELLREAADALEHPSDHPEQHLEMVVPSGGSKKPLALKLADALEDQVETTGRWSADKCDEAAAELRRLHAENEALRDALIRAKASIADWGSYASKYFQQKDDLQGDLDAIDAALARAGGKK